MNTSKQINVILGLMMVGLLGTLLYYIWDSNPGQILGQSRAEQATARQLMVNAERGADLFSQNCRSCHGITGQGAIERGGLPGAPLNIDTSRPTSAGALQAVQARFRDTIHCGRVGTLMPPWSIEQGGALDDFQILQLVTLITSAEVSEEGWAHAIEVADGSPSHRPAGDQFEPRKFLAAAIGADDETLTLNSASGLAVNPDANLVLRIGTPADGGSYELVIVTAVNADANEIEVTRGEHGSAALDFPEGTEVFNGPILPPEGPIVGEGENVTPPCGQGKPAAAAAPSEPVEVSGSADVTLGDNFFELDGKRNPALVVAAGETITLNLASSGSVPHNMRTAGDDNEFESDDDAVSDPDFIPGGGEGTLEFSFDAAGTYDYRCDFHPVEMAGTIEVQ